MRAYTYMSPKTMPLYSIAFKTALICFTYYDFNIILSKIMTFRTYFKLYVQKILLNLHKCLNNNLSKIFIICPYLGPSTCGMGSAKKCSPYSTVVASSTISPSPLRHRRIKIRLRPTLLGDAASTACPLGL